METLGEYRVRRLIGGGGMGNVYEAEEPLSGRRVALKVLHPSLAKGAGRERFFTEMRILSELQHPNIVRSLRCAEIAGELVLVLEYLEGRTLRDELQLVGRLPVERAVAIVSAVAAALVAAHERTPPIVHRDLKPENLMVLPDGAVKVMDFGIAKVLEGGQARTKTTQIVGTAQYMSPEQIDNREVSARCDLYALGVVLYELLTGKPPFEQESLLALLRAQCESPPPPLPNEVRSSVPAHVEQLLFRMLEKQPEARPSSAREVLQILTTGPTAAQAATGSGKHASLGSSGVQGRTQKRPSPDTIAIVDKLDRSRWRVVAAAGGALLVAGALAALLIVQPWRATAAPKKAKPTAVGGDGPKGRADNATATEQPAAPPGPAARSGGDRFLQWEVPASWTEFRANDLGTIAAYRPPRAAGDTEDAVVRVRAPVAASSAAERKLKDFDPCAGCFTETKTQVDGVLANVFEIRGLFFDGPRHAKETIPKPDFAMAGCYMPVGETHYEITLLGPQRTVAAARPDLDKLVGSLKRLNP